MLYTRNAKYFREHFRQERTDSKHQDVNFLGSLHIEPNGKKVEGFASLIYGNREDIGKLLGTIALNVAADDQAIYELIQNADDCKSSFFSVSYNEKYLLCINNGNYFSDNDMSAIINVAGNFKEGEDIGTFGIGFKILHRLVGTDDGRDAIINDYAGPILFSWNNPNQFEKFINGNPIIISGLGKDRENYDYEKDKETAWLIKILYTCFPSHYREPIRLGDYKTRETRFDESELLEMRTFLEKVLEDTDIKGEGRKQLQNGSIFFLKLGEGKSKFLDEGIDKIKSGISYSFRFLNSLKKIYINGEEIQEQKINSFYKEYKINSPEFEKINPKNKKRDIKFTYGFYRDYYRAENLRNELVPNLYTFFSMDEEKNVLNFLLHCNAFDMNNDRRKLQANSQINENLLPIIANEIIQYTDRYKDTNRGLYLSLYANLLLSKEPKSKPHINKYFFKYLKEYLQQNVPTEKGYSENPKSVKIKITFLHISPSDFGCPEIEWFAWQNERLDKILVNEAQSSEKLNLEKWNILDLLKYAISKGNLELINEWVEQTNEKYFADVQKKDYTYLAFVKEIDKNILEKDLPVIYQIKLFKFSDGNYYSLNEIFANDNLVLIYDKIVGIKRELRNLGFAVSNLDISKNLNLFKHILPKISEETLFKIITEKSKQNSLIADQKHNLFFTIANFNGVGPEKLKDLELFKDTQGNIRPLRTLLKGDLLVPDWLFSFKIYKTEYVSDLDKYLVKENEIYQSIIYKNWSFFINLTLNIKDFYAQVTDYFKQSSENQRLKDFACIFTNEGFKKPEQVFFNKNLNGSNYEYLQNAIFKISSKLTPNKFIFHFLTNEKSPFKISRSEEVCNYLINIYNLSYSETLAVLEFAKQNNEKLFSVAYLQNHNDTFLLVNHSQSVFQYYSNRKEINDILLNQPNFKHLPKEFNVNDYRELGIWQDKGLYMKILHTLDFSEILIPVIQESDKDVKLTYLSKIKNLELNEGKTYDRNSFEHSCLKLAIDCYEDSFQTEFSHKILINGNLRIKDIAVKDDINFEDVTLSLALVLPNYKGISDIITKIINQFIDFTKTELSDKVFTINNKNKDEIYLELQTKFAVLENVEQLGFLLYYSKRVKKNLLTDQLLSTLSGIEILQYAYKEKITDLSNYVNLELQEKLYPNEIALETEKLPIWVWNWLESTDKQEKLNYLSFLGVRTENSNIYAIRSFFRTGQITDIQAKIFAIPQNSVLLINTLKWLQNSTFKASESMRQQALRLIISRINYSQEIPLLYVSQITENETFYTLEVSTASKYYFETPQKEYSQKILAVLESKSYKLIALDFFMQWQLNIVGLTKIQTVSSLDFKTLKDNSIEWEDSVYKQWKVNQKYKIVIYKGEKLPYKILFLDQEIDFFFEGTSIEKEGVIYICQSILHDIRNQLAKYVNADELIKLYQLDNNNSSIVQTLQNRISQLEEVISNLLSGSKNNVWQDSDTFFDDFNQVVTEREYNLITGYKAEVYVYEQLIVQKFKNVIWTNQALTETPQKIIYSGKTYFIQEKGEPYDLTFIDDQGRLCYIQVKATTTTFDRADDVKMIITKREWLFLQRDENRDIYYMTRVFGARDYPIMKFFKMEFKIGT